VLFFAFLFVCNHWGEEGKTKPNEDILKGQTVQVIGLDETGLLPASFQMRAAGFLRLSAAQHSLPSARSARDVYKSSKS